MTTEFNPARWACAASGCPLLGSLTESVRGSETWYCRFHFQCPVGAVNGVTKALYDSKGATPAEVRNYVDAALAEARRNLFTPAAPAREFEEAYQ